MAGRFVKLNTTVSGVLFNILLGKARRSGRARRPSRLHHLVAQARERPPRDLVRQGQCAKEVGEVVASAWSWMRTALARKVVAGISAIRGSMARSAEGQVALGRHP